MEPMSVLRRLAPSGTCLPPSDFDAAALSCWVLDV